ncbi:tyrosine-protein phosphatase [Ureibacillus chungkukjangi]|uniref:Tyrosine-protein phosphatase n=1 Tax=Ureibacillus chungkukjangi TaxID=1202712 RepID=A0A318TF54_9BACL|nr:CpsB/CapC family capsule biosynthesis tyrosine phosphatase [Ureibacillus chungkukjangi]PYF03266.1 protein-tyrosine phosphatase [Ureibacillus chungkukjangi]
MIDMHSHVLWNVDDGPKTLEESILLLEQASREGITDLISTSHSFHPQYNAKFDMVSEQIEQLQLELTNRNIPLTLYTGHEVRLNEKLLSLMQVGQIHNLASSNYILLELPSSHIPAYTKNIIHTLALEGITPIIAHPERNKGIAEKPERLERLIREGAVAQITAGSLAGHFGKSIQKLSLDLVRANLVHTYGSDVHNLSTRPFLFEAGLAYLEKKNELDSVDMLLQNNKNIITNEPFILFEPEEVKKRKWWSLS